MTKTIGFVGLGLIGGSIARAIRRVHPDYYILAFDSSRDALALALRQGVIDTVCEENDTRFAGCDYVFLCAPVEINVQALEKLRSLIRPGCILTDAGSVKSVIHRRVEEMGLGHCFIGGHPMAGSERSGFENSSDRLVENAYYILTPGSGINLNALADLTELITSIGAIPLVLSCEDHDYITAGISHLPHLIASSLVNLVRELDGPQEYMKMIAAGGFRDITRIASSSPVMWQQICEENRQNISEVLDAYIRRLIEIRCEIDAGNGSYIFDMFDASKEYRESIDIVDRGPIGKAHAIYIELVDEPGGIAAITTILAADGINIKNMGIIHNREFTEGVLKIDFYDLDAMEKGKALLEKRNYRISERK